LFLPLLKSPPAQHCTKSVHSTFFLSSRPPPSFPFSVLRELLSPPLFPACLPNLPGYVFVKRTNSSLFFRSFLPFSNFPYTFNHHTFFRASFSRRSTDFRSRGVPLPVSLPPPKLRVRISFKFASSSQIPFPRISRLGSPNLSPPLHEIHVFGHVPMMEPSNTE